MHLAPYRHLLHELRGLPVIVRGFGIGQLGLFQCTIGGLRLCSGQEALCQDVLEFLGRCEIPRACLIEELLCPVKLPLADCCLGGIADLGDVRIVGTERADPFEQRSVVHRNFTQLRIEVLKGHAFLFQDFEEARESGLRHPQFFRKVLKLLSRNPFLTDNRHTPIDMVYGRAAPASGRLRDGLHDGCLRLGGNDAEHHQPDDSHDVRLERRVVVSAGGVARAR